MKFSTIFLAALLLTPLIAALLLAQLHAADRPNVVLKDTGATYPRPNPSYETAKGAAR